MKNKSKRYFDSWLYKDILQDNSGAVCEFLGENGDTHVRIFNRDLFMVEIRHVFDFTNMSQAVRLNMLSQAKFNALLRKSSVQIGTDISDLLDWNEFPSKKPDNGPAAKSIDHLIDQYKGKGLPKCHTTTCAEGATPLRNYKNEYHVICKYCGNDLRQISNATAKEKLEW